MKFVYTTGRIVEDEYADYGNILSTRRAEGDFRIGVEIIVKHKRLLNVYIANTTSGKKGIECHARYLEDDYKDKPFEFTTGKWNNNGLYVKQKAEYSTDYDEFNRLVEELGCPEETKAFFLQLVNCIQTEEPIGLYDAKYGDEAYDKTGDYMSFDSIEEVNNYLYKEITPKTVKERKDYYIKNCVEISLYGDLWDKEVECLHCGEKFKFNDFKVIKEKPEHNEDGMEYIVCKHYPKCDGSLIDMFPVEDEEKE